MSVNANGLRQFGKDVELRVTVDELDVGRRIGLGSCSSVHVASHKIRGERYAVKYFNVYDRERKKQLQKARSR